MMTLWFRRLFIRAAFLFCILPAFFLPLSGQEADSNVLTQYKRSLRELKKIHAKVRRQESKAESRKQQRRNRREFQETRDRLRREPVHRVNYEDGEEIARLREDLAQGLRHFSAASQLLQNFLNKTGAGANYDFPFYAEELIKGFPKSGIKLKNTPAGKDSLTLQPVMNPDRVFRFIELDLDNLKAARFSPDSNPPFAPEYLRFNTFFRFCEALEFCRSTTSGFNRMPEDYSTYRQLKHRREQLRKAAAALNKLLIRNSPETARTLNLPGMMKRLEMNFKSSAVSTTNNTVHRRMLSFGSDVKKSAVAMTPGEKFMEKWKKQLDILDSAAAALRGRMNLKSKNTRKKVEKDPLPPQVEVFADRTEKPDPEKKKP